MARPTEQPASSASISSVSAQRPESRRSQAELAYDLSRLNSQVRRLTLVSVQIVYGRNTSSNNATRSDPKLAQPAKLASSVLHPVPHCTHLTVSDLCTVSLTLHPVRPHISRSLEGSRAGGGADERRAPRHAGAQTVRRGRRLWGVRQGQGAVLLLHPCALARRRRVRARSRCSTVIASPAGRRAAAEGGPRSRLDSWERECACLEAGWAGRERVDAAAAHLGRTAP